MISITELQGSVPALFTTSPSAGLSSRYAHVTTADVVNTLTQDGWQIDDARQSRSRIERNRLHAKHELRMFHPELPTVGDCRPQLVMANSSDGAQSVRLFAGLYRFACANGLVIGDTVAGLVAYHRGNNLQDQVVAQAAQIRARFSEVLPVLEQWKGRQLEGSAAFDFARRASQLRWPESPDLSVNLADLLRMRRYEDVGLSLWHVFNRVQEGLIKGGVRVTRSVVEEGQPKVTVQSARKVTSITANIRINRGLWNLATEYANN